MTRMDLHSTPVGADGAVVDRLLAGAPKRHPLLELPGRSDVATVLAARGEDWTRRWLADVWAAHEAEVLRRDKLDNPKWDGLTDGWVLPHWWDSVRELEHCRLLYFGGGRRASKSTDCAWLCLNSWLAYPGGLRWCISDSEKTSQQTQQLQIWDYLPRAWREQLNMKESPNFKFKFQMGRGFTDNLLVLPTQPATTIYFLTINQKVKDYQGMSLGVMPRQWKHFADAQGRPVTDTAGRPYLIPNIGAWIDEDVPLDWLNTTMDRASNNHAKVLWSFTPLKGVTQSVRETIGGAPRLLESRPAELLPQTRRQVRELPDLPPGHMPYRIECERPNTRAMFFFKEMNPFSGYDLFRDVESKRMDESTLQREGYGWCREIRGRRFPKFGPVHLLPTDRLPAVGTNYRFVDPHPGRMWAICWVRVWTTAGGRTKRVIYRDWPDVPHYGEWAVPTARAEGGETRKGADGDPGPAQDGRGFGVVDYKRAMLEAEMIPLDLEAGDLAERDPHRRARVLRVLADHGLPAEPGQLTRTLIEDFRARHPEPVREVIFQSYFDPRAMANPQSAEKGGTTLADLMLAEQRQEGTGRVVGPSLLFEAAFSGKGIDDGVDHVNDLLSWDESHPDGFIADYNDPRLYVDPRCEQVRWMFEHYTGLAGSEGACKEWADLARYAAQTDLGHFNEGALRSWGGGGY